MITKPLDLLLNLIVTLLTPVFLAVADGDVALARAAALATINDYRAANNADLLAVGQMIAFSLAGIASICLSMADDIAPAMILRFRNNGLSCQRAFEQNRRARQHYTIESTPPQPEPPPEPDLSIDDPVEQLLAAEAQHRLETPAERARATTRIENDPDTIDAKRHQETWASVIAKEVSEAHAALPHLPPAARAAARQRADTLSRAFHDLTYQGLLPPNELEEIILRVCPALGEPA